MSSPVRRFYPLTVCLEPAAIDALRVMSPGPRRMGAVLSGLILQEAARREERLLHREKYEAALACETEQK